MMTDGCGKDPDGIAEPRRPVERAPETEEDIR